MKENALIKKINLLFIRGFLLLRAILFAFLFLPAVTAFFSIWGTVSYILTNSRDRLHWGARHWARSILGFMKVKVSIKGEQNIPSGGCLFLFNHTSFVDIFALTSCVYAIKFGAKIELFSIPFFGQAMKAAGVLPIARQRKEEAIQVLSEAEERAKHGEKFALAPEGGRNTEEKLLPFKSGPFIFAIKSGVPIVPVIIKGAGRAWRKNTFIPSWDQWSYDVSVEFLPAISSSNYTVESRHGLVDLVHQKMSEHF